MAKEKIVVGIDVGSSKVATLIGQTDETDRVSIIGVSSVESRGIKKGVVVDIDAAVESIARSLEAAERMAGHAVSSAFVLIGGNHIASLNSHGVVAISNPAGEINEDDVMRVTEAARAVSIPSSREIIHVLPRNFVVDSQEGIQDPIGMSGIRLEVETHIISAAQTSVKNLTKCVHQVGVDVNDLVFGALAASEVVLTDTEKELGVVLVDIGGGTTDIAIFADGSIAYSAVLPIGGKNITNDLAIGLRISLEDAEKIKIDISQNSHSAPLAASESVNEESDNKSKGQMLWSKKDDEIDVSHLNLGELKKVSRRFLLNGIMKPRLKEIMSLVSLEIKKSGYSNALPAGLVITGGSAQALGIDEVAKSVLNMPARIGSPQGVSGLIDEVSSPAYAATIGLLAYGAQTSESSQRSIPFIKNLPSVGSLPKTIVEWVKSFFP